MSKNLYYYITFQKLRSSTFLLQKSYAKKRTQKNPGIFKSYDVILEENPKNPGTFEKSRDFSNIRVITSF